MSSQPMEAEKVITLSDETIGLRGFMVLHDTRRGPATGGIRLYPYASDEDALADGHRLARAMTFKAAAADLPVGGGKIVVFEPSPENRVAVLEAIGRAIESLGGSFLAGRDVGVPVEDGVIVRSETGYMVDESEAGVGDLNLATALGVLAGARAAIAFRLGSPDLAGVRVALQGAGGVGAWLARKLAEEGAELVVSDTSSLALERLQEVVSFQVVPTDAIYDVDCELFVPCAIGGVLDESTAKRLKARVVTGSANNQLADPAVGEALFASQIAYAPDFLVNAGALIQGVRFMLHGERESGGAIAAIGTKISDLLEESKYLGVAPERLLEQRTLERLKLTHGRK